jgi:hypothetical protein
MVGLFKYLFFRIHWWNTNVIRNENYPIFGAIIGVASFQSLNIKFISDFILYVILDRRDLIVNQTKTVGIIVVTIVLVLNGIYYQKFGVEVIEKFKSYSKDKRTRHDVIILFYIIITLVSTIGLAYMIRNNY